MERVSARSQILTPDPTPFAFCGIALALAASAMFVFLPIWQTLTEPWARYLLQSVKYFMSELPTSIAEPAIKWRRAHPRWLQVMILLFVFGAGSVVGAMIAVRSIQTRMEFYRQNADALPNVIVPRLQFILELSDRQTEEIREIISRRHPCIIEYRKRAGDEMHTEFDAMEGEIAELLDEEQAEKWHVFADRVRTRFLPP